jgi:hypothetical protein
MNYDGKLHVYAQYTSHDDAIIVGTKDAVARLRDALNRALESGESVVGSTTADGEGFQVIVKVRDADSYYERVGLPYTADYHNNNDGILDPRDPEADDN